MRLLACASALLVLGAAPLGVAQNYQSSPHVEGDAASVRVYYDQRETHVKKEVFVYKGPKTEDVLSAVRHIMDERHAELDELVDKDDMDALRDEVLAHLDRHFGEQPDVLAAIRASAPAAPKHRGHWSVVVGLSSVFAGGPGLGGNAQLDGHLDVLEPNAYRQSIGLRAGFEVMERAQYTPSPLRPTLGENDRLSFHGWVEPGYELFWIKAHLAFQASLLLGAQSFEAGPGDRLYVTYGAALATELRIGPSDGTGVDVGIKWRMASMTRPVFPYDGLLLQDRPERSLQHVLLLYAGMYFSIFGS